MKSIFGILFLATVGYATTYNCEYGPSYWCSDFHVAVQCKAVDHCQQTVWSQKKIIADRSEKCVFCEAAIGEVRKMLADKQTVDEIQSVLLRICKVIPELKFSNKCIFIVNNDLPEFLNSLASHMDAQIACSLLGMCSPNTLKDFVNHDSKPITVPSTNTQSSNVHSTHCLVKELAAQNSKAPICTDCMKLIDDLKLQFTGKTAQSDIESYMNTYICSSLGSLSQECKDAVNTYVPMILSMLQGQVDSKEICEAICFCASSVSHIPRVQSTTVKSVDNQLGISSLRTLISSVSSAEGCLVCTTLFEQLQHLDQDPNTQAKVILAFKEKLCAHLGQYSVECDSLVDVYSSAIFELITSELDPLTRCKSFGFCLSKSTAILIRGVPVKLDILNKVADVKKTGGVYLKKPSETCVLCEFFMKEVDRYVTSNSTTAEFEAAFEKVCRIMPDTLKSQCTSFVDQYGPAIIEMLEQQLDPLTLCTAIGLCRAKSSSTDSVLKALAPVQVKAGQYCGVCQVLIQYMDSMLGDNKTQAQIEDVLEKVCNFLPTEYATQCDDIVEKYGAGIMILIESLSDPVEICTQLQLCTKNIVAMETLSPAIKKMESHQLGVNKCTWGPDYWCQDMKSAKECNAVMHCQKHAWMKKNMD